MGYVNKEMKVEWAELLALEESINLARSKNWKIVDMESDCASLVNRFNSRKEDLTMLRHRVSDIKRQTQFFIQFNFNWVPRYCNKAADAICSWAKMNNCSFDFNMDYPADIHKVVLNDAIN